MTKQNKTILLEVEAVVVGRDKTPVIADDVFKLAAIGCKDKEICDWFGIDGNTLRYNFSVELLKGREELKQSLRRAQLKAAMGGNVTMLIFLGKNLLGQRDIPLETPDETDSGNVNITVSRPQKPTKEELDAVKAEADKQ